MPLRRNLGYGPASAMMLSRSTITCCDYFCPFVKTIFHAVVSGIAFNVYVIRVESPLSFFPVTVYVPATSFNEIGAAVRAAGAGAGAGAGAAAIPVSAGGLSDFEQATAKTMELSQARRRINPPNGVIFAAAATARSTFDTPNSVARVMLTSKA